MEPAEMQMAPHKHAGGGEDEEEDRMLWEELEWMPLLQRARHAIVTAVGEDGRARTKVVVDVRRGLGAPERRALLGRLVRSVDHGDNERFFRKLRDRIDLYLISYISD